MQDTIRVIVDPIDGLVDETVAIILRGCNAGDEVTLRATMHDADGNLWQSEALFVANQNGTVNVTRDAPASGSYAGIDPMGLFWSMETVEDGDYELTLDPALINISAIINGVVEAEATYRQIYRAAGVQIDEVTDMGLSGRFFYQPTAEPQPAILVVGGSSGFGWTQNMAALLASRGFASLAVRYFGEEGLPAMLSEIPLEYFKTALDWLSNRPGVAADRIGVVGISKGGELALVLGSSFPEIKAVVAFAPFAVVMQGLGPQPASSWTLNGIPLPYLLLEGAEKYFQTDVERPVITFRELYLSNYRNNPEIAREAAIPVEKINGPVLIVTGSDDQAAPSDIFGDVAMERLKQHNHPHHYEHLCYQDAGHSLGYVNTPTTVTRVLIEVMGFYLNLGGTPAATAHARTDSLPKVLVFLKDRL